MGTMEEARERDRGVEVRMMLRRLRKLERELYDEKE